MPLRIAPLDVRQWTLDAKKSDPKKTYSDIHGFHLLKAEDFQVASIFYVKLHVIINVFLFVYVFLINTLFNTLSNKTVSKLNLVGYFKMRKCTGPI